MPFFDQYPYTNFHNINLDWVLQRVKEWGELVEQNNTAFHNLEEANENFKNYVTSYLENLDVQDEINNKLDSMLESGVLTEYMQPYISESVTTWLDENITQPTGVVIDSSLTVAGACADAKAVGERIATKIIPRDTDWNTIYNTGNYAVYINYNYTNNPINTIGTLYVNNYPNRMSASYTQYFVAQNFITKNGVLYTRIGLAENIISNIQWQDWNSVTNDNIQYGTDLKELAQETDWNNITETGVYQIYVNYNYLNAPNNNLGTLYVNNHYRTYSTSGGQYYVTQIFFDKLGDIYIRYGLTERDISTIDWVDWNSTTKEIKILFIGNSLTQDAVSYLPYVISNNNMNFPFKLYICYNGGFTLTQIYDSMTNNTPCQTFSKCENRVSWTSESNTWTINDILNTFNFDIICLQPYFRAADVSDEITSYNNCLNYIRTHYNKNGVKIVTLLHPPIRNNITVNMEKLENFSKQVLKNTSCEFAFRNDILIYNAMQTALDNLGDNRHLSTDGIHCQEGVPCLIQALYMYMCICEMIGCKYKSIYNTPIRITSAIYTSIHVPNPDIGSGVITGNDSQNVLAQEIAIKTFKQTTYKLISYYSEI